MDEIAAFVFEGRIEDIRSADDIEQVRELMAVFVVFKLDQRADEVVGTEACFGVLAEETADGGNNIVAVNACVKEMVKFLAKEDGVAIFVFVEFDVADAKLP